MRGKTIDELVAGERAELTRVVARDDLAAFVDAVGDYNPLHSDPEYAATTPFKVPIVPGIFTAGLISAVIGTTLPGPGAVYLSQDLKFLKPVRPGDTITARAEIVELLRDRNRIRLRTVCTNERGEEVLVGEAWVMPSRRPIVYEDRAVGPAAIGALAIRSWLALTRATATCSLLGLQALGDLTRRTWSA
jgi:acyl dehydratase